MDERGSGGRGLRRDETTLAEAESVDELLDAMEEVLASITQEKERPVRHEELDILAAVQNKRAQFEKVGLMRQRVIN